MVVHALRRAGGPLGVACRVRQGRPAGEWTTGQSRRKEKGRNDGNGRQRAHREKPGPKTALRHDPGEEQSRHLADTIECLKPPDAGVPLSLGMRLDDEEVCRRRGCRNADALEEGQRDAKGEQTQKGKGSGTNRGARQPSGEQRAVQPVRIGEPAPKRGSEASKTECGEHDSQLGSVRCTPHLEGEENRQESGCGDTEQRVGRIPAFDPLHHGTGETLQ